MATGVLMTRVGGTRCRVAIAALLLMSCGASDDEAINQATATSRSINFDGAPEWTTRTDSSARLFQVVDGAFTPAGVVLGERSTCTLRYYNNDGAFGRVVGGRGDGPGEFRSIEWLQVVGRSVYAYDRVLRRLSEFDLEGRYRGAVSIRPDSGADYVAPMGVLENRSIVVWTLSHGSAPETGRSFRNAGALLLYSDSGVRLDSLASLLHSERFVDRREKGVMTGPLLFGAISGVAVGGMTVYFVSNEDASVQSVTVPEKTPRSFVPAGATRLPISAQDVGQGRKRQLALGGSRPEVAAFLDMMPTPDSTPYYGWAGQRSLEPLQAMNSGRVWVLVYGGVQSSEPAWMVFSADGGLLERLTLSEEARVLDESRGRVLVLRWNADDEEFVDVRRVSP